jgi:hypothetical protein
MGTENTVAVPLCPPHVPHGLAWDHTTQNVKKMGAISNTAFNSLTTA